MSTPLPEQLAALDPAGGEYAGRFVDCVLDAALTVGASDVYLQPCPTGLELRWRLDGVLQPVGLFSRGTATDVVTRLKVMAELLTYRVDVPQEGRLPRDDEGVEMRVSTFPTLHGERAVVRLFAAERRLLHLADLELPAEVQQQLTRLLQETSGAIIISGPAGSGKTTTAYAALRELNRLSSGQRNLVSLEDPIEVAVEGVAQSQVQPAAGFDLVTGLRSLLRQDPDVILVGEIRDRETADAAMQASLTGHLVVTTFHAGSGAEAVGRLTDMGIEPYLLRSGILTILSQRLARRLCDCRVPIEDAEGRLGLNVEQAFSAAGCEACLHTGYRGRVVIAEMISPRDHAVGRAILAGCDPLELERLAVEAGMVSRWRRAEAAVERGATSPEEVRRVLGFVR